MLLTLFTQDYDHMISVCCDNPLVVLLHVSYPIISEHYQPQHINIKIRFLVNFDLSAPDTALTIRTWTNTVC